MRSDLKIQGKSLKETKRGSSLVDRQGKFHFTKNELFHFFCKDIAHILRVFPNFTVSAEGYLEYPPHIKLEFCLTLVNGWNLLPILTESSTLDIVEILDMLLVLEGYICD